MTQQLSAVRYTADFVPCQASPVAELGSFGLVNEYEDPDCKVYVDDPERRFLRVLSPQWENVRNIDLDDQYQQYARRAAEFPTGNWRPLFHMQTWMKKNPDVFNKFRPNIICSSRALRQALDIPNTCGHRTFNESFVACKRRGIIYLTCAKFDLPDDRRPVNYQKSYRLHRFEQLVTRGAGTEVDDFSSFEYFYSVIGRTIGDTRVLYSQKVDSVNPRLARTTSPENYMSLLFTEDKAAAPHDNRCTWKHQNAERSLWSKCFVSGSPRVLVGRKRDNLLINCAMTEVARIPDSATTQKFILLCGSRHRNCQHWNKERNVSFLNDFLKFVRNTVQQDYERSAYGFIVDFSNRSTATVRATEWCAGSADFEANNILRKWDQVEAASAVV
ncbi:uncharacterized protein LOC129595513 isoform X1 [Paramacrobiotus metropolitanus]|uniref:uncharacterized protein LOC129595513 isoform X1 n=1 Tax=Paramacrobiotus metropolitanus TaxID=2943436 RepID=UPI002445EF6F|nr:uncharacterized protein LOC129595513 isoform X1 [Paramacrobiotus metropolitanus]